MSIHINHSINKVQGVSQMSGGEEKKLVLQLRSGSYSSFCQPKQIHHCKNKQKPWTWQGFYPTHVPSNNYGTT